ncbi:MAG: CTP synthase [Candidatus Aminicenantes bacterium]|nr:CTP synthase [Candidatus Aminicenantes bacterium]
MQKKTKYIFVTGGVVSSLGKGVAAASIGALMESWGLKISMQKIDPYLNVDPGTLSPFQHGEVYVTEDGAETDLDLGHYERFTTVQTTKDSNYTAGKIYWSIINKERKGDYLGKTVQVIPHVTDEIKLAIRKFYGKVDISIIEIGGTVGDIESLPFLEAIRQIGLEEGEGNVVYVHLTLVPYIPTAGELKTKPTQHSVKELRAIGIQPDFVLARSDRILPMEIKRKIALFANVMEENVISAKDVETIYEIPLNFAAEGLDVKILKKLNLTPRSRDLKKWENLVKKIKTLEDEVEITMVGKYVKLKDSYKSLNEALFHAGIANNVKVKQRWVEAENIIKEGAEKYLKDSYAILVPGGFGERGIEGMIEAARYARENKIPYFGICLGMQIATIEFARHVADLESANSEEFDPTTPHKILILLPNLKGVYQLGGTMRLGAYRCEIKKPSLAFQAYKKTVIWERHRHRYEFNPEYKETLVKHGLKVTGEHKESGLVEIIEMPDHPWFLGCQFHPEFKSNPFNPHPLFVEFVKAAKRKRDGKI